MSMLLAFDTATERMSVALAAHGRIWAVDAPGGASASATLIPAVLELLADFICPECFTGWRFNFVRSYGLKSRIFQTKV